MTRRYDPSIDLERPLRYGEALAKGINAGSLNSGAVRHPFWGVVAAPRRPSKRGSDDELAQAAFVGHCKEYAPRLGPDRFFSHGTALRLVGAPVPLAGRDEVHVSVHRPAVQPRTVGVIGHRLQAREAAVRRVQGMPVEHPVRAWRQAGHSWRADQLTAAADFLVARRRSLATVDELRVEVDAMGGTPALRQALAEVRVGSESVRETELRLLLVRAGLPEPELNVSLRTADGREVARLDMVFRAYRVAAEYDGRQHAESVAQFARDADRWEDVRAAGVHLVRVLDHHMQHGGAAAIALVTRALRMAGWVE